MNNTNICRHDLQGKCRWGAQCRFTHVAQRPLPPVPQLELMCEHCMPPPTPGLGRCRFDQTGAPCPYGAFCRFSHGIATAPPTPDVVAVPTPTVCRHWLDKVPCPYGASCTYTHGFGEGLSASWVSQDSLTLDKLLKGWRVLLLAERSSLWSVAAVKRQFAATVEWPNLRIVHLHVGNGKRGSFPADPVEMRLMSTEEIATRVAELPRQRTLWLLGEPELLWNAVVAYHCLGGNTSGVAWVDAVLATPDRTAQMLARIQPDDASVFRVNVVM